LLPGTSNFAVWNTINLGVAALGNVWPANGNFGTAGANRLLKPGPGTAAGQVNVGPGNQPDLTPAEQFVAALYNGLLGRSGTRKEIDSWANQFSTVGSAGIAQGIVNSLEGATRQVVGLYNRVLGRSPESFAVEQYWGLQLLQNGVEFVVASLAGSAEFTLRANTLVGSSSTPGASFVTALYQVLLGRSAGSTELSAWVSQLSTHSQTWVARAFAESREFRGVQASSFYHGDARAAVGMNFLHRGGAPTAAEIDVWAGSGLSLLGIELAVAGSSEFQING